MVTGGCGWDLLSLPRFGQKSAKNLISAVEESKIISAEVDIEVTKKAREEVDKLLDDLKKKGSKDLKW